MQVVEKKYIIDKDNKKVAVQIDIDTFNKIEEIMENFALFHLIQENESDELLDIKSAKKYYHAIDKKNWKQYL